MKKRFSIAAFVLLSFLFSSVSYAQDGEPNSQPTPVSFKRNNGNGTCGYEAEIRVSFAPLPTWLPVIEEIRTDANTVTGIIINSVDASQLNKKGYASYCITAADIIPAGKLWIKFHYLQTNQAFWLTETHPFKN